MKKRIVWIVGAALLLAGIALLSYPTLSNWINRRNGSYAIQDMLRQVEQTDAQELVRQERLARAYNEDPESAGAEYEDILNFGGVMGYVDIPAIGVYLPIYHGTAADTLEKGVGHLPESDFPIGGAGYHAVLTGHTGLPEARLFTDLTELKVGDEFTVCVLKKRLTYRVSRIDVVLSHETALLAPVAGEDCCTLVTCTPYGVNSHRLLVRGVRVQETQTPGQADAEYAPEKMAAVKRGIEETAHSGAVPQDELPAAGDTGHAKIWLWGMGLSFAGILACAAAGRKNRRPPRSG